MFAVSTNKGQIETQIIDFPVKGIRIGDYEMSLEDFCMMATHLLEGGFFGWNGGTPKAVNDALSNLFEMYERVDGKWVRKAKYAV